MIDWATISMGSLVETYTVSNTGSFLFSRFRADQGVQTLATRYQVPALIAELRAILAKEKWQAEDAVRAYGCLVALSFHELSAVKVELRRIDLSRLKWGYQIVAMMEATYVPQQSLYVPYHPPANVESGIVTTTNSTNSVTSIKVG